MFTRNFSCSVLLFLPRFLRFQVRGFYSLWLDFPVYSSIFRTLLWQFGLFPVRSPLLGKSSFLSFPRVTEMFQFTRYHSLIL